MALKMAENSLFAILLRSSWWYSALIGLFVIAISALIAGGKYLILGIALSIPFFGISGFAAYKQLQQPGVRRIQEVAGLAKKMSAQQIADKIAANYTKERFESEPFKGAAAEIELSRGYRRLLLSTKRFKAANNGIEPLKQLVAAGEKIEANGYLYLALGQVSEAARSYAKENDIELINAQSLAAYFDGKVKIE